MKFQSAEAFEKHLREALPDHPSQLYIIFLADPFERRWLLKRIASRMEGEIEEVTPDRLLAEVASPSLFAEKRVLISDEVEGIPPLFPELTLVLGAKGGIDTHPVKKEAIILDLSKEKPWERPERIRRWFGYAIRKKIAPDAVVLLMEWTGGDFARLLAEGEKLITFVGERDHISKEDVQQLTHADVATRSWDLAEEIVWGGKASLRGFDKGSMVPFASQLRYQLHMGLQFASYIESKQEGMIPKSFPKLRTKALEKYKGLASRYKTHYFVSALRHLYDLELRSRKTGGDPTLHLDLFIGKLEAGRP